MVVLSNSCMGERTGGSKCYKEYNMENVQQRTHETVEDDWL